MRGKEDHLLQLASFVAYRGSMPPFGLQGINRKDYIFFPEGAEGWKPGSGPLGKWRHTRRFALGGDEMGHLFAVIYRRDDPPK